MSARSSIHNLLCELFFSSKFGFGQRYPRMSIPHPSLPSSPSTLSSLALCRFSFSLFFLLLSIAMLLASAFFALNLLLRIFSFQSRFFLSSSIFLTGLSKETRFNSAGLVHVEVPVMQFQVGPKLRACPKSSSCSPNLFFGCSRTTDNTRCPIEQSILLSFSSSFHRILKSLRLSKISNSQHYQKSQTLKIKFADSHLQRSSFLPACRVLVSLSQPSKIENENVSKKQGAVKHLVWILYRVDKRGREFKMCQAGKESWKNNYLSAQMIQYLDMRGRAIRLQRQLLIIADRADQQSRRDKQTDGSRVIVRVTTVELVWDAGDPE